MNKEQGFLLFLLFVSLAASIYIILPMLQYILGAIIIAYILFPINQYLQSYLDQRLSPIATLGIAGVVLFLPLWFIIQRLYADIRKLSRGETTFQTSRIEQSVLELTGRDINLGTSITELGNDLVGVLFGNTSAIVSTSLSVSIGGVLLLFLIYYLLKDGQALLAWIIETVPLSKPVCGRLFERIDQTTRGVILGHLFVAVVQGLIGGIGLFLAGVPNIIFWTFTMVILALMPIIGAFLVWAPAAVYLFIIGETVSAIFLVVYGIVVVSMVDNYLRPLIVDRTAHLNPAIVLVGVFGGTYAIGMTGVFIGPIILAVFIATVGAFADEYETLGVVTTD